MTSGTMLKRPRLFNSYERRHKLIGLAFAIPVIVFLLAFVLYPVLYNVWLSET